MHHENYITPFQNDSCERASVRTKYFKYSSNKHFDEIFNTNPK